jgi:cysteinyl-tRNA synthetase
MLMSLKLYNTLTRTKEEFQPIHPGKVGIYTCGPTVYDYAHIGNLRTYLFADILRRTFEYLGYDVKQVMNITDVGHLSGDNLGDADTGEDRMEVGARREGKSAWDIASFYTDAFFHDATRLNMCRPHLTPKATDHIADQIELVKRLEEKGYSYRTSDGIYFDTSRFSGYGKLSGQRLQDRRAGARVEVRSGKRHPADFALWKFSPPGSQRQMEWESPWGVGFPGWHAECSAMSTKYLGQPFDIHTGGVDHIAIHHTNEIAQSEAAFGVKMANWWMHGEFLQVNFGRMGKSVGNFITLENLVAKGYDPLAYRYLCLNAHYRSPLNFTWETLDSAASSLENLRQEIAALKDSPAEGASLPPGLRKRFKDAISDDLNMPQALAVLWEVLRLETLSPSERLSAIPQFDRVLGLKLEEIDPQQYRVALTPEMEGLIQEREAARSRRDWTRADEIRAQLSTMGIIVEDTPEGPVARRARK